MLVDSHCHLDFPQLHDRLDEVLDAMHSAGIAAALCVGVSLESQPRVTALAERYRNIYATVGVHPEQREGEEATLETLVGLARHERVLGIGETGLDYYWHKDRPEWQRERFRTHIRAARAVGKPLIVHMRESAEDVLRILKEEGAEEVGGVMHCFTGTLEEAEAAMALGFLISFSGIVTFKNAAKLRQVAAAIPLERLLVETDAPFLAPVPHRGRTNEPAFVRHVAEEIAALKGIGLCEVEEATTSNFCRLFRTDIN